jgi:parallel beta-helix repeat protein
MYTGNTFSGNGTGVSVAYSANNPVLSGNTFSNNTTADISAYGTITGTATWDGTSSNGTYYLQSLSIAQGATLNIASGNTVKLTSGAQITVNGTLKATGVHFTSDGQNQWSGILFQGSGASNSRLDNCIVENASGTIINGYPYYGMLRMVQSSPTITGCTFNIPTGRYGIYLDSSSAVISNSTFSGTGNNTGINVTNNSAPTVTGSTFSGNGNGISIAADSGGTYTGNTLTGNTSYGLYFYGLTSLNATNNNWGDPSGPLDDSDDRATGGLYNPNGKGNRVSDHVNYFPWIGTTITQTATPSGLSGIPRYTSINLNWNANTEPILNGYKIYYGTTSGSYGTPIVIGKVTSYKLANLTNGTPYYLAISSLNTIGAESALTPEITVTPINKYTVDLTLSGTGKGNVLFSGGTACNTNCSVLFDPSTVVTLKANGDQYSLFKGWSGTYTAATGDCQLTMNTDNAITATFNHDIDHSVLIDLPATKYYTSISAAYLDISGSTVIKVWGTDFTEDLLLDKSIDVTFEGGFDAGYNTNTGNTTLHGTVTVMRGSLAIENLIVY